MSTSKKPLRWVRATLAAAVTALTLTVAPAAHADTPGQPPLPDGFGLTKVATDPAIVAANTPTNFVITVTTPQVAGTHHIRIMLPADYYTNTTKHYPVLYFLHGTGDDPANASLAWPALRDASARSSMITVEPDGGLRGWYANWLNQNTAAGAQNWETFHLGQVIPFIDADLRTIPDKAHRAIAGLSMGGFGAMHYAEDRPDLFSQVASLSGAIDLGRDSMDVRMAAVGTLTNGAGVLCGSSTNPSCPGGFGPTVDSDALFGTPYPFSIFYPFSDVLWNAADPSTHLSKLTGMGISLYVGNGNGNPADEEFWAESATTHVKTNLDALGMPSHYVDYGNGAGWGTCAGHHDAPCWAADMVDFVPRLEAAFGA
ncbi:alpha/beta hydrolase-fold protein [Kitasatospora sp. NPDC002227]|uniref:alpha/beta hydrolase n=1 Tax=Kitasatospora sp. NPDC002227 TaxID=3154773 RepID=UPI00331DBD84